MSQKDSPPSEESLLQAAMEACCQILLPFNEKQFVYDLKKTIDYLSEKSDLLTLSGEFTKKELTSEFNKGKLDMKKLSTLMRTIANEKGYRALLVCCNHLLQKKKHLLKNMELKTCDDEVLLSDCQSIIWASPFINETFLMLLRTQLMRRYRREKWTTEPTGEVKQLEPGTKFTQDAMRSTLETICPRSVSVFDQWAYQHSDFFAKDVSTKNVEEAAVADGHKRPSVDSLTYVPVSSSASASDALETGTGATGAGRKDGKKAEAVAGRELNLVEIVCSECTGSIWFWVLATMLNIAEVVLCGFHPVGGVYNAQVAVIVISIVFFFIQLIGETEEQKSVIFEALGDGPISLRQRIYYSGKYFLAEGEYILEAFCLFAGGICLGVNPGIAVLRCFRIFRVLWYYEIYAVQIAAERLFVCLFGENGIPIKDLLFRCMEFSVRSVLRIGTELFFMTLSNRGGFILMLMLAMFSYVVGATMSAVLRGSAISCGNAGACQYVMLRLTFFDGTGFDFAKKLTAHHPFLFFVCILYTCITSFGILNGLIGIMGNAFNQSSRDVFVHSNDGASHPVMDPVHGVTDQHSTDASFSSSDGQDNDNSEDDDDSDDAEEDEGGEAAGVSMSSVVAGPPLPPFVSACDEAAPVMQRGVSNISNSSFTSADSFCDNRLNGLSHMSGGPEATPGIAAAAAPPAGHKHKLPALCKKKMRMNLKGKSLYQRDRQNQQAGARCADHDEDGEGVQAQVLQCTVTQLQGVVQLLVQNNLLLMERLNQMDTVAAAARASHYIAAAAQHVSALPVSPPLPTGVNSTFVAASGEEEKQ